MIDAKFVFNTKDDFMKAKQIPGVPIQKKGGFHDTESTKQYDIQEMNAKFEVLKERFFSINQWKNYCGDASADFKHFDSSGNFVERIPVKGDFIRIAISDLGTKEGKGYDWVKIIEISYRNAGSYESCLMICNPSKEPNKQTKHIAHFYGSTATSSILISRELDFLSVGIYGRNEKPNFNAGFFDKIRNFCVAFGGILGFGKIQWKLLADGLLDFK